MPDLDLIKQAEQGCMRFGRISPAIFERAVGRLQRTRVILLLICCRSSKRVDGAAMNYLCRPGEGRTHHSAAPDFWPQLPRLGDAWPDRAAATWTPAFAGVTIE
jgi:hypothetical protein